MLGVLIDCRCATKAHRQHRWMGCKQASVAAYFCGLAIVHSKVLFQSLVDLASTLKHAWGGSTNHDVILAHLGSVEHGVECCHFVHSDRRQIQHLCYLCSSAQC